MVGVVSIGRIVIVSWVIRSRSVMRVVAVGVVSIGRIIIVSWVIRSRSVMRVVVVGVVSIGRIVIVSWATRSVREVGETAVLRHVSFLRSWKF